MTTTQEAGTVKGWLSPEFIKACEKATADLGVKVEPTRRQFSKYRNGYGLLARADGTSTRKSPPGK
jgi:hypothetical protein